MERIKTIIVKPNASKTMLLEEKDLLRVAVKAQPKSGKANLELLKLLQKRFNSEVQIIRGHTKRKKLVRVENG